MGKIIIDGKIIDLDKIPLEELRELEKKLTEEEKKITEEIEKELKKEDNI